MWAGPRPRCMRRATAGQSSAAAMAFDASARCSWAVSIRRTWCTPSIATANSFRGSPSDKAHHKGVPAAGIGPWFAWATRASRNSWTGHHARCCDGGAPARWGPASSVISVIGHQRFRASAVDLQPVGAMRHNRLDARDYAVDGLFWARRRCRCRRRLGRTPTARRRSSRRSLRTSRSLAPITQQPGDQAELHDNVPVLHRGQAAGTAATAAAGTEPCPHHAPSISATADSRSAASCCASTSVSCTSTSTLRWPFSVGR